MRIRPLICGHPHPLVGDNLLNACNVLIVNPINSSVQSCTTGNGSMHFGVLPYHPTNCGVIQPVGWKKKFQFFFKNTRFWPAESLPQSHWLSVEPNSVDHVTPQCSIASLACLSPFFLPLRLPVKKKWYNPLTTHILVYLHWCSRSRDHVRLCSFCFHLLVRGTLQVSCDTHMN